MEIENTLLQMSSAGLVEIVEVKTGGRPAKRYRLAKD
jgi:DNA-binding PadR family transcriptional regulator